MPLFEAADEPVVLCVNYVVDPAALKRGYSVWIRRHRTTRIARVIFAIMGLLAIIAAATFLRNAEGAPMLIMLGAIAFALAVILPHIDTWHSVQQWRANPVNRQPHRFEVTETSYRLTDEDLYFVKPLSTLHAILKFPDFVIIAFNPSAVLVIPDASDFGSETFDSFCEKLQYLHDRAKQATR
ncbi:MAG: hypothetical protein ACT4QC_17525 [Planctomycetaceae bacterium]